MFSMKIMAIILLFSTRFPQLETKGSTVSAEPVFVNVYRIQESIPRGWESIPGLLKRPTKTGSGSVSKKSGFSF
jgi:hypothetical protein